MDVLHRLSASVLRELAASLRGGALASGPTMHAVQQIAGPAAAAELVSAMGELQKCGWTAEQMADLATAVLQERERGCDPDALFDLVLSGPDVRGIPTRDTAVVMQTLMEQAQDEVILVGYAIYEGRKLFERLAQKMAEQPDLDVWFCLNIQRSPTDTSLSSEIVQRFAAEFVTKHWPWNPRPKVYYYRRSVEDDGPTRSSLHAKCLIVDRREALVTSANFTEAAQRRNVETGVIVRHQPMVERLAGYFVALKQSGQLRECSLRT